MNVTARRSCSALNARTRTRAAKTKTKPEREPSDMAIEMLTRILRGLWLRYELSIRDQQILFHYLFGRTPEQTGARLSLRETTVHKHLHRVYAKTNPATRRELIELGLELARAHGIAGSSSVNPELPTLLRAA